MRLEHRGVAFLDGLRPFVWPPHAAQLTAAFGRVGWFGAELWPAELAAASAMSERRAKAYGSGRRVAHVALSRLGAPAGAVTSEGRVPRWPAGFTGSITHSETLAVAVVARLADVRGVGVDVEVQGRVDDRSAQRVLIEAERRRFSQPRWTLAFSAKEAVYKAVNPIVGEYLGFADVAIETTGQTFAAATTRRCASSPVVAAGRGFFRRVYGHWLTVFVCRPATATGVCCAGSDRFGTVAAMTG